MREKLLPEAELAWSVETYDGGDTSAVGAGGGFPCQAGCQDFMLTIVMVCVWLQDISQAGGQEGLGGSRSVLCKHTFRVYDTLKVKIFGLFSVNEL